MQWVNFDETLSSSQDDEFEDFLSLENPSALHNGSGNNDEDDKQQPRAATTLEKNVWSFVQELAAQAFNVLDGDIVSSVLTLSDKYDNAVIRDPTDITKTYRFNPEVSVKLRQLDTLWRRQARMCEENPPVTLWYKVAQQQVGAAVRSDYIATLHALVQADAQLGDVAVAKNRLFLLALHYRWQPALQNFSARYR